MDVSVLALALIGGLGMLGLIRGVRSEGISLAIVLAAAVVLGNEAMRSRITGFINRVPRLVELMLAPEGVAPAGAGAGVITTPDQRLFFALAAFLVCCAIGYYLGFRFGGGAFGRIERLLGLVLGAVSGFVVAQTLVGFSSEYLSRNPAVQGLAIDLPQLAPTSLPATNWLAGYAPFVFIAATALTAGIVVVSLVRR